MAALNISQSDIFQLSLYIQSDPQIEQRTDSKVTIYCSPLRTKSIIHEQNGSTDYSRKDDEQPLSGQRLVARNQTIAPSVSLAVQQFVNNNESQTFDFIESRIDILRGRIPFLKSTETGVLIGDDLTLIIRTKELGK